MCIYIERESGNTHTQNPKDCEDKTMNRYLLLVEAGHRGRDRFSIRFKPRMESKGTLQPKGAHITHPRAAVG